MGAQVLPFFPLFRFGSSQIGRIMACGLQNLAGRAEMSFGNAGENIRTGSFNNFFRSGSDMSGPQRQHAAGKLPEFLQLVHEGIPGQNRGRSHGGI